jgi:mannose-6-phosphate isomerase
MASLATYTNGGKSVVPIRPAVQNYAWGIRGLDARVARYALEAGVIDEVDPDRPYAELWIGTHDKVSYWIMY